MKIRKIVHEYFTTHPDAHNEVMKAYHAYNVPHFRLDSKGHNFPTALRESACQWCGRTREQVRWDEMLPECAKRPQLPEIENVILGEELKAFSLIARAEKDVPNLVAKLGMNGETLAVLHHTHGYDPETVASIVTVPPQILADYHAAMETERARSRAAQVKEVITVRTTEYLTAMI